MSHRNFYRRIPRALRTDWKQRFLRFLSRAVPILILIVFWAAAWSQTPPQFSGLLTDTTDYTTNPAIWLVPPAISVPGPGTCYYDPNWKVNQCRIPTPVDCAPGTCSQVTRNLPVDYAKVRPWSVDDSYFIASGDWLYLYSRSSNGTYTPISRINTSRSKYKATRDYGSDTGSKGLVQDWSNWLWANNPATPHVIYYTGSSASNPNRFQLKAYDADADRVSVVHDFTATIATVNSWGTCSYTATSIDMQREGNQSDDDRYWAFGVTNGTSSGWCAVIVYDKTADSVIALRGLGPNGMCGASACSQGHPFPNWVGMSPSGSYVVVNWQDGAWDTVWTPYHGTEIYDRNLNRIGVASGNNGHGDVGYDANGVEVYVDKGAAISPYSNYSFAVCNLSQVHLTPNTPGPGGCQHYFAVPCSWSNSACPVGSAVRGNTFFISMRGSHGAAQGWLLLSTQTISGPGAPLPAGNGGFGAVENVAYKVDWSAETSSYTNGSTMISPAAPLVRLGRNHAIYAYDSKGDGVYSAQANAVPNYNFTKFTWTSTWDQTPTGNASTDNYLAMITELGGAFYTLTTHTNGSGAITGCAGSYPSGSSFTCAIAPAAGWSLTGPPASTCGILKQSGNVYSGIMPANDCTVMATFSSSAASPASIAVSPTAASIAAGSTRQFSATCTYMDSSSADCTASVTWSSSNPAVATISAGGLASAEVMGTTIIKATSGNIKGSSVLTVSPSFSIAPDGDSTTNVAISPGGVATYDLVVTPIGSATFRKAITLTAGGLPPNATADFTPSTIAAGLTTTKVSLAIKTSDASAGIVPGRSIWPIALGTLFLPLAGFRPSGDLRRRSLGWKQLFAAILLIGSIAVAMSGCSNNVLTKAGLGGSASAPAGYIITVIAASGEIHQTTTVTMTIR